MATWSTPALHDADNLPGSNAPADYSDWRCSARRFHDGTGHAPTPDAGYTTAGSSLLLNKPVDLFTFGGSQIRQVRRLTFDRALNRVIVNDQIGRQSRRYKMPQQLLDLRREGDREESTYPYDL